MNKTEYIFDLVPKDKSDNSNIKKLKDLSDEEIKPILFNLLEWIQDCNWPIASDILPILASHPKQLMPLIHIVLQPEESDDIWKYWIIECLVPLLSKEDIDVILMDIKRIAYNPTRGEKAEETNEVAKNFIQNRYEDG